METLRLLVLISVNTLFTFTVKTGSFKGSSSQEVQPDKAHRIPSQLFLYAPSSWRHVPEPIMARRLAEFGHESKLISPQFVRPFVKSNKNDFIDAEAICRAACRPSMRFVTPKTESQQTLGALHRVRIVLCAIGLRHRTRYTAFLLEFGISLPVGHAAIKRLPSVILNTSYQRTHYHVGGCMPISNIWRQQIAAIDKNWPASLACDDLGQRLMTIPGVRPDHCQRVGRRAR